MGKGPLFCIGYANGKAFICYKKRYKWNKFLFYFPKWGASEALNRKCLKFTKKVVIIMG